MGDHFQRLLQGYRRARIRGSSAQHAWFGEEVARPQKPVAILIGCSDSRIIPEMIFDAAPGELFVVRNVANLVPPPAQEGQRSSVDAALAFSILDLGVEHVIIMGHAGCGGITAYLQKSPSPPEKKGAVDRWIEHLHSVDHFFPAYRQRSTTQQTDMEHAGIRMSIAHLRGRPFIAERERLGRLQLHGLWFNVRSGDLRLFHEESGHFLSIPPNSSSECGEEMRSAND